MASLPGRAKVSTSARARAEGQVLGPAHGHAGGAEVLGLTQLQAAPGDALHREHGEHTERRFAFPSGSVDGPRSLPLSLKATWPTGKKLDCLCPPAPRGHFRGVASSMMKFGMSSLTAYDQAAGLAHEGALVRTQLQLALALGAGEQLDELAVQWHPPLIEAGPDGQQG